ncbi:serine protease [Lentzea tibetensis]|uniref:Serine protease n=1 Tax=Lentzea tibetensis TaxID=2591470 RepID=A0A563EG20_9PSEU|nr:serine protease [Lentzea tibetensis]TWP44982.1 serine protease [Lentzea tibetensis]
MRLTAAVLALFLVTAAPAGADPRIVGGTPVGSIAEYPWMVALTTAGGYQYCGGALVGPALVATAAHCVYQKAPTSIYVVSGRLDLTTTQGAVTKVTQYQIAGGYTIPQQGKDIALLTLANALPGPVLPIADSSAYLAGTTGTVLGWGRLAEGDTNKSPVLRKASVPIMADAACTAAYTSYQADSMFCAGLPQGGVDSCTDDSGGPFVVNGKLAGIVSWGKGCARPGQPGVYTRVTAYLS